MELHVELISSVAGHWFQGTVAVPGEVVQFIREPDNAADPDAIAVHDSAGVRIGYLFRKLAAEYAALIDHGLVQLRGRLLAPGEPGYDAERARVNPPLVVSIYAENVRIDALLARSA